MLTQNAHYSAKHAASLLCNIQLLWALKLLGSSRLCYPHILRAFENASSDTKGFTRKKGSFYIMICFNSEQSNYNTFLLFQLSGKYYQRTGWLSIQHPRLSSHGSETLFFSIVGTSTSSTCIASFWFYCLGGGSYSINFSTRKILALLKLLTLQLQM